MASDETIQQAFEIIGEAISLEPDEFQDHETWKFLGLGDLLGLAIVSDLQSGLDLNLPGNIFEQCPTVESFKEYLKKVTSTSGGNDGIQATVNTTAVSIDNDTHVEPNNPWEGIPKPKVPLSVVLQGKPDTSSKIVFLFPDGSGAGTSYGTLPAMGEGFCLIGLNSPFLRQAQDFACSIERMARLWVDEVRRLQPKGKSYILGGWSAGGYYSYEVAKLLIAEGEEVAQLILIDSPCRLIYEALPEAVVAELTRKGLMGASGERKAPEWLVQHFTSTVVSVGKYIPTPLPRHQVPPIVSFIWVKEGLVKDVAESGLDVDLNIKVTRFLLEPRGDLRTEGWERLLPGASYGFQYMTGNHFQITQPPHCISLGKLLHDAVNR